MFYGPRRKTLLKTLWEKKKMLETSIFFFFHYVFKSLLSSGLLKLTFCGKRLTKVKDFSQALGKLKWVNTFYRKKEKIKTLMHVFPGSLKFIVDTTVPPSGLILFLHASKERRQKKKKWWNDRLH